MFSRRSIWTDPRLIGAAVLAFAIRYSYSVAFDDAWQRDTETSAARPDPGRPLPTRPPGPDGGPMADLDRVVVEQRVRKINLDDGSSAEQPMGPMAASLAFGGVVLLLGGLGSMFVWRKADEEPADQEPEATEVPLRRR